MASLVNGKAVLALPQQSDEVSAPPAKRSRPNEENINQNNSSMSCDLDWESWNSDILADRLKDEGLGDVAKIFKDQEVIGSVLPQITEDHLDKYGISKLGKKLQVLKFIQKLMENVDIDLAQSSRKIFNDPIHGHIELHPLCVKIIDTPQFQRLRFLKQLGTTYYVYPGATHNRFEHSLGVCHLAGRLVRAIQRRQPRLGITEIDVLCLEIAGLCHDLGHGPFSHLFDGKFIPHVRPDTKWKHEDASRMMFHHMLKENNLFPEFEKTGLSNKDITFIVEQIAGPKKTSKDGEWPYEGRPRNRSFLYEVVANKRNGIDVDKWDYFARDCHMLGIKNNFDHNRCIHFARVLEVEGELQICSRDKEVGNLYDMFHTRSTLHRRAYQHKTTNIVDTMVVEAMIKANDYIKFTGKDGVEVRMSDAIDDMVAFSQITDHVFFLILNSTKPELQESREILSNIHKRKLYKCVGQTQLDYDKVIPKDGVGKVKEEIMSKMDSDELECSGLKNDQLVVHLVNLDYGMKDKNPVDNVRFYSKENPNIAVKVRKDQVSNLLPETFAEQQIRIHCKVVDPRTLDMIKRAFRDWCKDKNLPAPKGGEVNSLELTPVTKQSDSTTPKQSIQNGTTDRTPDSAGKFNVCHLAGRLVRAIQRRQPCLGISEKDVLCLEIAGLCHDLGHGPFSHLFDGKFIPSVRHGTKWKHEDGSWMMFHHMLEVNNLFPEFEKEGLSEKDITFIVEQIAGPKETSNGEWPYEGRQRNKRYLYEEVGNLYGMFQTRSTLHRRAYQHETTNIVEKMVAEALIKANDYIKFTGNDGVEVRMSDAIDDMVAFSQITYHVFFLILNSTKPELQESREILSNIHKRKLYKCVGQTQLDYDKAIPKGGERKVEEEIMSKMDSDELLECPGLKHDELVVLLVNLDYGMKDKNPVDDVRFYSKENRNIAVKVRKDQVWVRFHYIYGFKPTTREVCKTADTSKVVDPKTLDMIMRAFRDWCKDKNLPAPKGGEVNSLELTPSDETVRLNNTKTANKEWHHK